MEFEWDSRKAASNLKKHSVPFLFAIRVFLDEHRLERFDSEIAHEENRWITIGLVDEMELAVVYTVRAENIRIISARKATSNERKDYWNR